MNIYLVRHGETEENKSKYYYGSIDAKLNDNGKKQIVAVADKLKYVDFGRIFVSEKKRAQQSFEIIRKNTIYNKEKSGIVDKRLSEMNFGEFEGKNYKEIEKLYPDEYKKWNNDWKNFSPPGGESYADFFKRVKSFFDDILQLNEENILVITHGGVIRTLYCCILDNNPDYFWKFSSQNGDISIIKYEYGNLHIDSIEHTRTTNN